MSPQPIAAKATDCDPRLAPGFRCVTLTVPLDHFAAVTGSTTVTFAMRPHSGPGKAKGVWVTATGGPGSSGISLAAAATSALAPSIRSDYDIVFFDQRGGHLSGPITCPHAALAWHSTESTAVTSTAVTGLAADAKTFVADCLAEGHIDPASLPYYSTRQVAEDLEAFRLWLHAPKLTLYGQSYGSELMQMYAQAHPEHVRALFVDGPIDLTQTAPDFSAEQTRAFGEALVGTLLDCSTQPSCTRTVSGGNELNAYDQLAARLARGAVSYRYTLRNGTSQQRQFSAADLATAASSYVYTEADRMLLQRAVAAASQGDFWYLSRLVSAGLGQDPDTGAPIVDASWSDALYYAVRCTDHSVFSGSPEERATAYLAYGRSHGIDSERLGRLFYNDLPCAWWPAQPADASRPAPLTDTPYPLFVLGATLDPVTPWANAERIFAHDRVNAHLIVKPGGPHVIFGRGEACPDDVVTAFLVDGQLPSDRRTVCPGDVANTYVPTPEARAARYGTTEAALRSVDVEIVDSADYLAWDGSGQLRTGCRYGGWVRYRSVPGGVRVNMRGCTWARGLPLTGTGLIAGDGSVTLDVAAGSGRGRVVHYERAPKGKLRSLTGTLAMFGGR